MTSRSLAAVAVLAALSASSCNIVEETGRSQLTLFSDGQMTQLGSQAYTEQTSQYREITGSAAAQMVQRVGVRIARASGRNYQWEFKLLDAPDVPNAFCLPGGKIAIFSGILPITENEDGLAAVMGHEVAHATSHHGNERMSQGMAAELGLALIGAGIGLSDADPETKASIMGGLGIGAQYGVLLPFSRDHESEADEIGLRFLVRSGYDPNEAPRLWERMAKAFPSDTPEFLSTHPDPLGRAQRLREMIPQIIQEERPQQ